MHDDALSADQRAALLALAPTVSRGFYLAGGTGLCLRLAHRRSLDIDLFREEPFDTERTLADLRALSAIVSRLSCTLMTQKANLS